MRTSLSARLDSEDGCLLKIDYYLDSFCSFRGAQFERPLPVSGGVVHAADYRLPRICLQPGCGTCQRCPQCPSVPQDHGRGEISHSNSSPVTFTGKSGDFKFNSSTTSSVAGQYNGLQGPCVEFLLLPDMNPVGGRTDCIIFFLNMTPKKCTLAPQCLQTKTGYT